MTIGDRLRDERKRLGLSQTVVGEIAGVTKMSQINYEKDARAPDAAYLAAIAAAGADVQYILTGQRSAPALRAEEERAGYTLEIVSPAERRALEALRASGALQPSTIHQTITAPAGQVSAGTHINQSQGSVNVGQSGGKRRR